MVMCTGAIPARQNSTEPVAGIGVPFQASNLSLAPLFHYQQGTGMTGRRLFSCQVLRMDTRDEATMPGFGTTLLWVSSID